MVDVAGGRFLSEFAIQPRAATQVHIKARSSCITAGRKENGCFFSRLRSIPLYIGSFASLPSGPSIFPSALLPVYPLPRACAVRASISGVPERTRCIYRKSHIKNKEECYIVTAYELHDTRRYNYTGDSKRSKEPLGTVNCVYTTQFVRLHFGILSLLRITLCRLSLSLALSFSLDLTLSLSHSRYTLLSRKRTLKIVTVKSHDGNRCALRSNVDVF